MARGSRLRELIISFGATSCVALFEIDDATTVTVLAIRHQREEDFTDFSALAPARVPAQTTQTQPDLAPRQ